MPMIGATCQEDTFIYPLCFMIFWYTQYVFFGVTTFFYKNDYFMDEDIVEQRVNLELKFDQDLQQVIQSDNYMQLVSNTPLKMRKQGS